MAPRLTAFCILVVLSAMLATGLALASAAAAAPVDRLEANCEAGVVSSCAFLGVLYRHGKGGVPRDYARAIALHRKACAGGSQFACGYVGDMTYLGLGTEQNKAEGERMLRQACNAKNKWSCDTMRRHGLPGEDESAVAINAQ